MPETLPIDRGNGVLVDFPVPGEGLSRLIAAIPALNERFEPKGVQPKTVELFEQEVVETVRAFCEANGNTIRTLLCIADDQLQVVCAAGTACLEAQVMDEITALDVRLSDLGWYADCMSSPDQSIGGMRSFAEFAAIYAKSDD